MRQNPRQANRKVVIVQVVRVRSLLRSSLGFNREAGSVKSDSAAFAGPQPGKVISGIYVQEYLASAFANNIGKVCSNSTTCTKAVKTRLLEDARSHAFLFKFLNCK